MKIVNTKLVRQFLPDDLKINDWSDIAPFFLDLEKRELNSIDNVKKWMLDRSELEAIIEEEMAWRYINTTRDTQNKEYVELFEYFVSKIEPEIQKHDNLLDKKISSNEYFKQLDDSFLIIKRNLENKLKLFREENIPIFSELQKEEQEYGAIASQMLIEYKDEKITLHQAANYLKSTDRTERKTVYELINNRRLEDAEKLDNLLDKLIEKRQQVAKNAGFDNYRDYKHIELSRFDYSVDDVLEFHKTIEQTAKPVLNKLHKIRKQKLGVDTLKPYDLDVDLDLKSALKPFKDTNELVEKTIKIFSKIKSEFGDFIYTMQQKSYLDLEARPGKAPGGYNYPLYESNIPFIFTNATGNLRDVETLMHEGGHAVHSFLSRDLPYIEFKNLPSEVAELASMSMELISMEYWDEFFSSEEELKRAKMSQLQGIVSVLPWVATVDKFQHEIYTNKNLSHKQRNKIWAEIFEQFASDIVDWTDYEHYKEYSWQKQLHIYEVPFYYIEYAISQLGAIAIWRNFKKDKQKTIDNYAKALSLGYSKPIGEIYKAAGIKFSFEKSYVEELMHFVSDELDKLIK